MDYNFLVAQFVSAAPIRAGPSWRASRRSRPISHYFKDQLLRQPGAAPYRPPFHRLRRRRRQRGIEIIRARGLRPAGGALRHLCEARRFHGPAEHPKSLAAYRKGAFARAATPALNLAELARGR